MRDFFEKSEAACTEYDAGGAGLGVGLRQRASDCSAAADDADDIWLREFGLRGVDFGVECRVEGDEVADVLGVGLTFGWRYHDDVMACAWPVAIE